MIRPSDRTVAVAMATQLLAADIQARGGTARMAVEDYGQAVNTAARLAAALLAAVMRHLPSDARSKQGDG